MKLGVFGKLYRSTGVRASWGPAGVDGVCTAAAPGTLDEVPNCRDIAIPMEDGETDVTTRGNAGYKATMGSLRDAEVEITMIYDAADTDYQALRKAYLTRAVIGLALLEGDKATAGNEGFWADFAVLKMRKGEELEGAQTVVFTVKPGWSAVPPEWVKTA